MANIEQDLQAIMDARYGRDVRQSIHDAIYDINEVNEANISTVQAIADTAQGYANTALQAKTDAQTAQTGAETAQTHAETAEDGAEHFYQETLAIAQALGSALIPRGTVEFANLPSVSSSEIKDGYMWNISDPFTTTSDFVEGAGLSIPMGANVYRITINNTPKWDILAGSSAQVYTGTEAQIEQAIQQGLLGEGVMINSLDDGEDELLTTSMIYHHNESLEDAIDDIDDEIGNIQDDVSAVDTKIDNKLKTFINQGVLYQPNDTFTISDDSTLVTVILRNSGYSVLAVQTFPMATMQYLSTMVLDAGSSASYNIQATVYYDKNTKTFSLGNTYATGWTFGDVLIETV